MGNLRENSPYTRLGSFRGWGWVSYFLAKGFFRKVFGSQ